jgi:hypothetical protein
MTTTDKKPLDNGLTSYYDAGMLGLNKTINNIDGNEI